MISASTARCGLRFGLAFVLLAPLSVSVPRNHATEARPATAKLAPVLADLARALAPEAGVAPALREPPPPEFSLASMPRSVRDAARGRMLRINANAEVQVYILMNPVTDEGLRELAAHGVTVEIADAKGHRVQARIPVTRLEGVAGLARVNFIRLPNYAVHWTGSVATEGDAILGSDQARQQLGLNGTGVRVGVISDGIKGIFATGCTTCSGVAGGPIATGDLPAATGTRNTSGVLTASSGGITGRTFTSNNDLEGLPPPGCGFAGAGAEGTALLEIVHDIAPGAQLSFANIDTDMAMMQAVNFLAASNDIVVDDLGFLGLPTDGTSEVSQNTAAALNNPANRIRGYYTSVGNSAHHHYFGLYADSGVSGTTIGGITTAGNLHRFQADTDTVDVLGLGPQPYNLLVLPTGGEVWVFLTWDDPFGASTNNYELYLVREDTNQVVASDVCKSFFGSQDPVRCVNHVNPGSQGPFRVVVQNVQNLAQAKHLNMISFEPQCATDGPRPLAPARHERLNFNTATRSLLAQSDAGGLPVSVVSVGAICSASSRVFGFTESCSDTTHSTIEFFSSLGPTLDGRTKPDISGIDGVSVTGAGSFVNPFFGSSAAAPHVAGMAALVLESAPCLLDGKPGALDDVTARTHLRSVILDNAVPLGGTIPNNTFGYGRADALASVEQTLPTFGGPSTISVSGTTPTGASFTASQLGFNDPNSCPLTTLNWSGGCGTGPAARMNCPFGAHNVSVSASNNGVSFSSPVGIQIVVTNFAVGASPASQTVTAGESASYTVTVSAEGGAYTNPVTLSCANLPAETACSFDPLTVTPGASSATSTLTIATTPRPAQTPSAFVAPPEPLARWAPHGWPLRRILLLFLCVGMGVGILYCPCVAPGARAGLAAFLNRRYQSTRVAPAVGLGALAAVTLAGLGTLMACGAGSSVPVPTPTARLSPSSLTFSPQGVGTTSAAKSVTLSNTGNASLAIASISASGDFGQTNDCGATLAAGANCTINVTFTPTAAGERSGTLSVADNALGSPHTVSLTGTGLAGTAAGTYSIDIVGTAGTLTNSGTVTLVVE